jgi:hypothetical protein
MLHKIARPGADEYADFHKGYLAAVGHDADGLAALDRQQAQIEQMRNLTPEQSAFRYADGKWTVKEVVGHLADVERVLSYRLLRIARGDETPLTRIDEKLFAANSNANRREIADLAAELSAIRGATLALVRSLDEEVLQNRGKVSEWTLTARALVFIIAGHFAHHAKMLREQYRVEL